MTLCYINSKLTRPTKRVICRENDLAIGNSSL